MTEEPKTKPAARFSGTKRKMASTEDNTNMDICTKPQNPKMEGEEDNKSPAVEQPNLIEIRAHKCVLTARADYFEALFRKSVDSESGVKNAFNYRRNASFTWDRNFSPALFIPCWNFSIPTAFRAYPRFPQMTCCLCCIFRISGC